MASSYVLFAFSKLDALKKNLMDTGQNKTYIFACVYYLHAPTCIV